MKRVYAILLIGIIMIGCGPSKSEDHLTATDNEDFLKMMRRGDVSSYIIFDKRNIVKIYLVKDSMYKYKARLEKHGTSLDPQKPQFLMEVVSGSVFMEDMKRFFKDHPMAEKIPYKVESK